MKFIDFYAFFTILGPSIEPEKPSVKSASTANPPSKCHFIAFFINSLPISVCQLFFNNSRPNWLAYSHFYLVLGSVYSGEKPNSFSVILVARSVWCFGVVLMLFVERATESRHRRMPPKRGNTGGKQQAIVRDLNHDGINLSLPNWSDADRGPTAPYRPGPVYRHSLRHSHHRQH
jgi:hypothetical protein